MRSVPIPYRRPYHPRVHVTVFGELTVLIDGEPADLGGPKPRALLALLVAAEGRPVSVSHLVDEIWGEQPPPRVEASLQSYVARLRRELEPARRARATDDRLRTHPGGYSLGLASEHVDARRFAELVRTARSAVQTDPVRAEALFEEALTLWRGDPYTGLTETSSSLAAEALRLTELRLTAVEDVADLRVRRDDRSVAADLEQLVRQHPSRERLWALLALGQYRSGRQADALGSLRRAREHLAEELGIDPGPDLRALEQSILRQDPDLLPRPAERAVVPPQPTPVADGLAGREPQLAAVDGVLADAARGRGRVVVVTGEPGIGKTRFTEELLVRSAAAGFRSGRGTWDPDGSPPLWGWTRAVRGAFGSERVLAPTDDGVRDAATESYRLAEALLAAAGEGPPVLLVLDDVHWADTDSLRLIRRVAAELTGVPLILVVALRVSPADAGAAVADLLGALARLDPVRFDLLGLDAAAVASCVAAATGMQIPAEAAAELVARTDGNPFFVTEMARLLAAEGALTRPGAPGWHSVPGGVRDVVRQRLAQLPAATSGILAVAAVAGRSFELAAVEQAAGCSSAEIDDAMESALALGLVDVQTPGRYRFTHALVRDAVYETLPAPARTRTHASVAAALEDALAGQIAEHTTELAEHYRLAGDAYARSGWSFARRAGETAAARSAHAEARRLFAMAAELQERDPLAGPEEREAVQVGLGRALLGTGRPIDAWPAFAAAGESAVRRGDPAAAAGMLLEITSGAVWGWRIRSQVDADAVRLWRAVLDAPDGVLPPAVRARAEAALAVEHLYAPDSSEASVRLIDSAVARLHAADAAPQELDVVLQLASSALARPELLPRRVALADELVERARRTGDEPALALALTQRAGVRAEQGRIEEAHSDLLRARQLAERHSLPQVLLISGWGLALLRQAHGDLAGAEDDIVRLERLELTLAAPGVGIGLAQRTSIRWAQGRLAECEPLLRQAAEYQPTELRDLHALALVEAGRPDEARRLLGPWSEQPPVIRDYLFISLTALRAWLWLELHDRGCATDGAIGDLRRELTPYADRFAAGGLSAFFLGSVHHTLARLADVDGDPVAAEAHAQAALDVHRRLGLAPWTARTEGLLSRLRN